MSKEGETRPVFLYLSDNNLQGLPGNSFLRVRAPVLVCSRA